MTPRRVLLIVLAIAPMLILSSTAWSANATLFYLGMLPAAIGLLVNVRVAVAGGVLTGALMMLAVLLRDEPVTGALLMTAIGAVVGLSSVRGWHGVGAYAGPQTSFALIGAPMVALASGTVAIDASWAATTMMGGSVAAGGLWIAFIGWLARDELPIHEPHTVPMHAARYFAGALAALVGIGAFIAMQWSTSSDAWWLILTLFVVVQPFYAATLKRSAHRVIGTVLGAVVAAVVAELLAGLPVLISIVTLVVTAGAVWAKLTKPYWVYATFLTPAVILPTSSQTEALLFADVQRVAFTVSAAVVAVGVLSIGHRIVTRHQPASSLHQTSSERPATKEERTT
jgi:hypothetical protein